MSYMVNVLMVVMAIGFTGYFLFSGKRVIYECQGGNKYVVAILFFILGIIAYIRYRDILTLITFVILVICGGLYSVIPSGFGSEEFIVLGRRYNYKKCEDIDYEKSNNRLEISFKYKRKTLFLFQDIEKESEVKDLLRKVRIDKKL